MSMMSMNAMESLKDLKMVGLDLVSGLGGCVLYGMVKKGLDNMSTKDFTNASKSAYIDMVYSTFLVLVSRVIVDFLYYHLQSKTNRFGGTNLEFILSSIVWLLLMFSYKKTMYPLLTTASLVNDVVIQYLATFLVMLATARLTGWG